MECRDDGWAARLREVDVAHNSVREPCREADALAVRRPVYVPSEIRRQPYGCIRARGRMHIEVKLGGPRGGEIATLDREKHAREYRVRDDRRGRFDTHDFDFDSIGTIIPDVHAESVVERLVARSEVWEDKRHVDWSAAGVDGEIVWGIRPGTSVFYSVSAFACRRFEQTVSAGGAVRGVLVKAPTGLMSVHPLEFSNTSTYCKRLIGARHSEGRRLIDKMLEEGAKKGRAGRAGRRAKAMRPRGILRWYITALGWSVKGRLELCPDLEAVQHCPKREQVDGTISCRRLRT